MKSSKTTRVAYTGTERKNGKQQQKQTDKTTKLDRKSSRGMIFENEELRLRTININAEVERGQSDIKRLRRENEQLRREIWTLRDECDRLNKRFKAKLVESARARTSSHARGSVSCRGRRSSCDELHSGSNSEDSDSCELCKTNNDCSDACCREDDCELSAQQRRDAFRRQGSSLSTFATKESDTAANTPATTPVGAGGSNGNEPTGVTSFDHLSVVSEETLSNSEVVPVTKLPKLVGPVSPLTPVELVANQLNDLQSMVPPLSYFENVVQQHMASNLDTTPESAKTTDSAQTVVQTNGWDYNLQSPFAQRKQTTSVESSPRPSPSRPNSGVKALTSFAATRPNLTNSSSGSSISPKSQSQQLYATPVKLKPKLPDASENSQESCPKHFFAPMKPRLKLNTALANRSNGEAIPVPPPIVPPRSTSATKTLNCAPPDLYVANALASPYKQIQPQATTAAGIATFQSNMPIRYSECGAAQTDSANLESILNDIETISEDILAIKLEKKHETSEHFQQQLMPAGCSESNLPQTLRATDKTKKPYRSEMNLQLSYAGSNTAITPTKANTGVTEATNCTTEADKVNNSAAKANGPLRRRTRSLERDSNESPSPNVPDPMAPFPANHSYIGFDQLNAAAGMTSSALPTLPPAPPPKPAFVTATPLIDVSASATTAATSQIVAANGAAKLSHITGLSPNKSQLYASLASGAAAKREQFRAAPSHLTRSLDVAVTSPQSPYEIVDGEQAERRKERRVSIQIGDGSKSASSILNIHEDQHGNLKAMDPYIISLRQSSHSTPNSPQPPRRSSLVSPLTPSANQPEFLRNSNQDVTLAVPIKTDALTTPAATATVTRPKCSRRNSDATLASQHRHHHGHNHAHHTHQPNTHHSHYSHQESYHDNGTSISDRHSNSSNSSSRESSASFSLRSQRRKLSVGSHAGGKIPWCGCWGNGCL